jgi:hypothetical protein
MLMKLTPYPYQKREPLVKFHQPTGANVAGLKL